MKTSLLVSVATLVLVTIVGTSAYYLNQPTRKHIPQEQVPAAMQVLAVEAQ